MFYVVSYDIPDDRKRDAMAKILLDFGSRVQYSVFECILDNELLDKMIARVSQVISEEDRVSIYPLCARCEAGIRIFGKGEVTKDEKVYIL
jgi:CRISPR-associated protein Cas2